MINQALWIGGGDLLRRTFTVEELPAKAQLLITGLGYYVCYINGKRVGDIEAAPSYTYYEKRVEYNRFDVTALLRRGENVLAIMLGSHWPKSCSPESLRFKPYYKGENMALCALEADGRPLVLSGVQFKAHSSPVLESGIYDGEVYDASAEPQGWREIGLDDRGWKNAELKANGAELTESYIPPVRIVQRLEPAAVWHTKDGNVYDFDVNIAGKLTIEGDFVPGSRIMMRHAECIFPKTHMLNTGSLRTARATDTYIARGGGETYTPFFTYHGFRYAQISSDAPENLERIRVIADDVHTDVQSICEFETDNAQLNAVFSMMRRTFLNNMYSIPTDCHQRDERQGWLGDAQLSCESILHCFDAADFYRKYLDDIADTIADDGNICYFTAPPLYMGESLMWSGAYYMIVEVLYRLFDDSETLKKHYPHLCRYYAWLEGREQGGFPQIGGLGDWLGIAHTDEKQIRDAVYIDFTDKMAQFAAALGDAESSARYTGKCVILRQRYNELYYSPHESTERNSGYYGSCDGISQLGNALPLCFDIPDPKDRPRIVEKLVYDLKYARGTLFPTTGLIGTKYLFEALEKAGRSDLALDLLLKRDYPSLGFILKKGATTVWERWEYMTDNEMNSHCHTPLAAPCKWLVARLAGITHPREENGGFVFTVDPYFTRKLRFVRCSLRTRGGTISVRWERRQKGFALFVEAPENAQVCFRGKRYGGGKIEFTSV